MVAPHMQEVLTITNIVATNNLFEESFSNLNMAYQLFGWEQDLL